MHYNIAHLLLLIYSTTPNIVLSASNSAKKHKRHYTVRLLEQ